jgi:hypothetical protein
MGSGWESADPIGLAAALAIAVGLGTFLSFFVCGLEF